MGQQQPLELHAQLLSPRAAHAARYPGGARICGRPPIIRQLGNPGLCLGRYHADRQPGAALQNTAICPAAPPPDAACAAGQSHSTHDTVIRPGPHSCPFWHRSG